MPRNLSPAIIAALSADVIRPAIFVSIAFATDTVNAWSGLGPYTWNGMAFQGVGDLGSISSIEEGSEVEAQGLTVTLSGIPSNLVADAMNGARILLPFSLWIDVYDVNGVLIDEPFLSYKGLTDQPSFLDSGDTCTITIAIENVLVDLNRAVYRRYTADDQKIDLAATLTRLGLPATTVDTGFNHVATIQEENMFWGIVPSNSNNV